MYHSFVSSLYLFFNFKATNRKLTYFQYCYVYTLLLSSVYTISYRPQIVLQRPHPKRYEASTQSWDFFVSMVKLQPLKLIFDLFFTLFQYIAKHW